MELELNENGINVVLSFDESEDFNKGEFLVAINNLVEMLKDCSNVNIQITSEDDTNTDPEDDFGTAEILADMEEDFVVFDDEDESVDDESEEDESTKI